MAHELTHRSPLGYLLFAVPGYCENFFDLKHVEVSIMQDSTQDRFLAIKVRMMPRETNPHGTIFGGVLLSYVDQAGAVGAEHEIRSQGWPVLPLVTVGMNSVEFHEPVYVGDVVSFWTKLVRVGRTSITMHVLVETVRDDRPVTLTEAEVSFVTVDRTDGKRRPVPVKGE